LISLEGVAARRAPMTLASVSVGWGPGVHAIVGTPADGGPLLLALVAGAARLRAGRVRVLDRGPGDASVRAAVAFVPLLPTLPEALRVHEALDVAAAIRGDPPGHAAERLASLGLQALAPRRIGTLAPEEARAVALAEATTSDRVRILLLEEPLVDVDPRAAGRLPELLRARAREGRAVLVATASPRDAGELADDHVTLRTGTIVGRSTSLAELASFAPGGARMVIVSSDPQALIAAIAKQDAVEAVARRDAAVVARGRDATALAAAVGRAVLASGVDVTELRTELPTLAEARDASAGVTQATYDAAYERTRAALAPPPLAPTEGAP
jgi:ABC-2 type transport system ATP-binding protein